jgi:hypothetical protein
MNRPKDKLTGIGKMKALGTEGIFHLVYSTMKTNDESGKTYEVLIKTPKPSWQLSASAKRDFLADSLYISRLKHENIQKIFHANRDEKGLFVVVEYQPHSTKLADVIKETNKSKQRMPLAVVLQIMKQACNGVKSATRTSVAGKTARRVVHGLVCPENIVIDSRGVVKLKDFGVYRLYDGVNIAKDASIDSAYLSPEQLEGQLPNELSDLYSLGKLFVELLQIASSQRLDKDKGELSKAIYNMTQKQPTDRTVGVEDLLAYIDSYSGRIGFREDPKLIKSFIESLPQNNILNVGKPDHIEADEDKVSDKASLIDPNTFWNADTQPNEPVEEGLDNLIEDEPTVVDNDKVEAKTLEKKVTKKTDSIPPALKPESARPQKRPTGPSDKPKVQSRFILNDLRKEEKKPPRGVVWAVLLLVAIIFYFLVVPGEEGSDDLENQKIVREDSSLDQNKSDIQETKVQKSKNKISKKLDEAHDSRALDETIELTVTSKPSGAILFVDNVKKGITPKTVEVIVGEQVDLKVEMDGYRSWEQVIDVGQDEEQIEIHAELFSEKKCDHGAGWIYLSSTPSGAVIELDGTRLPGKTPKIINDVCAGEKHHLRVQALGYLTWYKEDIEVTSGQVLNLKVELEK